MTTAAKKRATGSAGATASSRRASANPSRSPRRRSDLPDVTRKIKTRTKEALIAASAGRCELPGCPRYLFVHTPTKRSGYFGNYAHIRAFSPGGPRAGRAVDRARVDLNDIENLMLLCPECHVLVDRHAEEYPIAKLQTWKREHEERVTYLLELPGENEAAVIEIWTSLAKPPVVRSYGKVVAALLPLYPSRIHSCLINLADHDLSDMTLVPAAVEQIDKHLGRLFATSGERPTHVAVFGITNIPLLVHLGLLRIPCTAVFRRTACTSYGLPTKRLTQASFEPSSTSTVSGRPTGSSWQRSRWSMDR